MSEIEELVKRLRRMSPQLDMMQCEDVLQVADALEAQTARIAELQREKGMLEAQVKAFKESLNNIATLPTENANGGLANATSRLNGGWAVNHARNTIMSALKMTEKKDG